MVCNCGLDTRYEKCECGEVVECESCGATCTLGIDASIEETDPGVLYFSNGDPGYPPSYGPVCSSCYGQEEWDWPDEADWDDGDDDSDLY